MKIYGVEIEGIGSGSFIGTSSYATNASTASYLLGSISSASYARNAETASYFVGSIESASYSAWAISSSYAQTSSYFIGTVNSASYASTASYFSGVVSTSSYSTTSSYAHLAHEATSVAILTYNGSGIEIAKGKVVRINGFSVYVGGVRLPSIVVADYSTEADSDSPIGIAHDAIPNFSAGKVLVKGYHIGLNTTGSNAGDILYLAANGDWTNVEPTAPYHLVKIGQTLESAEPSGSIFIDINAGYEIDELHNVKITSAAQGDLLMRSGSVFINSKHLTGSYFLSGSLTGTSSYAVTSSYSHTSSHSDYASLALSASYAPGSPTVTASYSLNSGTSSLSMTTISSSYANVATSSSHALNSATASYYNGSVVSSSYASTSTSSSYSISSSYSDFAKSGSHANMASTASYLLGSVASASYSATATSSSYATTASYTLNGGSGGGGVYILRNTDSPYYITGSNTLIEQIIICDHSINDPITIHFPNPTTNTSIITVKVGLAGTLIKMSPYGSEEVDGTTGDYNMSIAGEARRFATDGTNWFIIGHYVL